MDVTEASLFVTQASERVPYHGRAKEEKKAVHWGNRKLTIAEIELLALFWDPVALPKPKILYVGAAPGSHIDILAQMFPEVEFHLYDPRKFSLEENLPGTPGYVQGKASIKIYTGESGFFTDDKAREWSGRGDVIFICDIRSGDIKDKDFAAVITADMKAQERWYNIIQPRLAQLKFRLPYYDEKRDGTQTFKYLGGRVMKGIWTPASSTEARLIPEQGMTVDWDLQWYEDTMAYHNRILRETPLGFRNLWTGDLTPISDPELVVDFDSVAEAFILRGYLLGRSVENPSQQQVAALSAWITDELNAWSTLYTDISTLRQLPLGQRSSVIRQSLIREGGLVAVPGTRTQRKRKGVRAGAVAEDDIEED